jgi:hypothetical protein
MNSSPNSPEIDLTVPSSSKEADLSTDEKMPVTAKFKIGRYGIERYYANFKEHNVGDLKGKTSATCVLCKDQVWHVKQSTTNYSRHLKRKHPAEFQLWSADVTKEKKSGDNMLQTTLQSSLSPIAHPNKYGSSHPRQIELSRMIFHDLIIGLDLPLSITEKPSFIRAMLTVDAKFRVPSRRSITSHHLSQAYEQIVSKLKSICSLAEFISLTFDAWTDRRMRAFYAVTMHYINQSGQLKAHLLAFNPLCGTFSCNRLIRQS